MAKDKDNGAGRKLDQHKGTYVGAYLSDGQYEKLERIQDHLEAMFGSEGASRSKALRYIVDYFDERTLPTIPKDLAPAMMNS